MASAKCSNRHTKRPSWIRQTFFVGIQEFKTGLLHTHPSCCSHRIAASTLLRGQQLSRRRMTGVTSRRCPPSRPGTSPSQPTTFLRMGKLVYILRFGGSAATGNVFVREVDQISALRICILLTPCAVNLTTWTPKLVEKLDRMRHARCPQIRSGIIHYITSTTTTALIGFGADEATWLTWIFWSVLRIGAPSPNRSTPSIEIILTPFGPNIVSANCNAANQQNKSGLAAAARVVKNKVRENVEIIPNCAHPGREGASGTPPRLSRYFLCW